MCFKITRVFKFLQDGNMRSERRSRQNGHKLRSAELGKIAMVLTIRERSFESSLPYAKLDKQGISAISP